ncbi:unnamed protein product [Adineta steineri]|uniref:Uncharacterized protein n=1 Tax=Adineta steineri TaxID=433720 RepID=A0A818UBC2_9BILA|nr:unnamed protein product [Adineta steineri]CAF0739809.1 unnamed protein product [Adineta steineri]CAF3495574.1 unnamed protein product [Adineta steineri]CAF3690969.1 unnamed protein product [Adineta steineri]
MRGTTTMNIGACIGFKEALAANRFGNGNNDRYPLNPFIGKNFFEGENYRAALERLDEGYGVAMDLIELMQDYLDNEREQIRNLVSYGDKWVARLKQQSTLVSYHTTKRAQLDAVRLTKEIARVKESNCNEIQKVIEKYHNYVNETYISERFRPGRKHRRTQEFKKLFKTAHTSLREVSDELETLRTQEKKAQDALHTAESACEILELDPTTTEKQLIRANENQTKKRTILNDIEDKILDTKEKYKAAQKTYRKRATEIFKQCQFIEEERLDQMRETLLDFIQAMYTQKYATDLNQIYENVSTKITTHQNSFDDLVFWAKSYGIENKLTKSLKFKKNDSDDEDEEEAEEEEEKVIESRSTKKSIRHEIEKNDKHSTVINNNVDNEEPLATKTKLKRTKTIGTTDKKNTNATEPSVMNNTILNQV